MRRLAVCILACIASISCTKDVGQLDDTWTRVVGGRMNSYLRDVEELENGNIVAVGQKGYAAFTSQTAGGVDVFGKSDERAAAIYLFDSNGYLLKEGVFRTEEVDLIHNVEFYGIGDKAMFLDVLPAQDGGFIVLGEWRNFSWYYGVLDSVFPASSSTTVPFICKFDANLELQNFWSVTGSVGSAPYLYSGGTLFELADGTPVLLVHAFVQTLAYPHGYALMILDVDGNRQSVIHDNAGVGNRMLMRDVCTDVNGDVVIVGQYQGDFTAMKWDAQLNSKLSRIRIDYSGVGSGINGNQAFIQPKPDGTGFYTAHMNAPQTVVINELNEDFEVIDRWEPEFTVAQEYPSDFKLLPNGDLLLQTFRLDSSVGTDSRLYRIVPDGSLIWARTFEGTNGIGAVLSDDHWLVTENPKHGELLVKSRLHKIKSDGTY